MRIRNLSNTTLAKNNLSDIDGKIIFQSIERYINNHKGISKGSILEKFENMKERNVAKNEKLLETLGKLQARVDEIQTELDNLNKQIDVNLIRIKELLS